MTTSETGKLIYISGRHIPTFNGEKHKEKSRGTKISEALKGRPKPPDQVIVRSTVWEKVRPLFLRGALFGEIAQVTGLTQEQIRNAVYRKRPQWHSAPSELFSRELEEERRRRAAAPGKPKRLKDRTVSDHERNDAIFARELFNKEFVLDDLSYYTRLSQGYRIKGRNLPSSFLDRLRLEVFLRALENARGGNLALLNSYRNIGLGIDPFWFESTLAIEEDFVATILDSRPLGVDEDALGYFRTDKDGNKWREPIANGESGIIVDSSRQALGRRFIREWKPTAS